jgi:hypothetical protein
MQQVDIKNLLLEVRKQFEFQNEKLVLSKNNFFDLYPYLLTSGDYKKTLHQTHRIYDSFWKIFAVIKRIEITKNMAKSGIIPKYSSIEFDWLRIDISHIHYEIRSAMDLICWFLEKHFEIEVKQNSYNELLKVKDKERLQILGHKLLEEVKNTEKWFSNLRNTRTKLLHRGEMVIPINTDPEFSFSGYYLRDVLDFLPKEVKEKITDRSNNIYCIPYLTIYICLLLNFIDKVGEILLSNIHTNQNTTEGSLSVEGLDVFCEWIERTDNFLK